MFHIKAVEKIKTHI